MTYTSRIRLFLILLAVLPVMIVMGLIWYQYDQQSEQAGQREAQAAITKYGIFDKAQANRVQSAAADYIADHSFTRTISELSHKNVSSLSIDPKRYGLSFAEIVSVDGIVRASFHRQGLLGRKIEFDLSALIDSLPISASSVEYDLNGPHATLLTINRVDEKLYLYSGVYIDSELLSRMKEMTGANIRLIDEPEDALIYSSMTLRKLYRTESGYEALLAGADTVGFYLVASFDDQKDSQGLINLLGLAGLVGLISMIISIAVGMFITSRSKREIDNLVEATNRIAQGDLTTPIMAYEEGEFSQLADAFSTMIVDLKKLQNDLATTEKIAAWQSMGRKIAHEIRNPMTPIAISVDDLRQSYHEKLDGFDEILDQTTSMIRSEVTRLSRLLDEFVSFAKMTPPIIKSVELEPFINELSSFYRKDIESGRFTIKSSISERNFPFDRDAIWQLLLNLIKNAIDAGEETGRDMQILLTIERLTDRLMIIIEDNGLGFSPEQLANSFEPQISTKKSGSGLGLVICQRIVIDHGGRIKIYNRKEGGAGVRVSLPDSTRA